MQMAFLEYRMDTLIERGARGGPTNRGRKKVYVASGALSQQFLWSSALRTWDVSHGVKTNSQVQGLLALWHVVNFTPYSGFRFRDWADFRAQPSNTAAQLISGTTYQLQRAYTFGGVTHLRTITKPCAGVILHAAGGGVIAGTVDLATGIATVPAGVPVGWSGTFDLPVTFQDDEWVSELEAGGGDDGPLVITGALRVEEIRLPP